MGVIRNKLPWGLHGRGERDSQRHKEKIRKAIKENLHHIISEEAIISTDGKRKTKVPVRYLDSYHFKHGYPKDRVGSGPGKPGQILRKGKPEKGDGDSPREAGKDPGEAMYDTEVTIDDLTQMMAEDLGLPNLESKDKKEIITKQVVFTDIRKKGIISNWAKRRTLFENIRRNAIEKGRPVFEDVKEDDMRYRTWEEKIERHSNAVIYLMMDRSGSMDDHKKYLCKATFWWLCRFLEERYDHIEIVFIAHDAVAQVVPEKDFFTIASDGGTICSSAYDLCWKDIRESRPSNLWNVYCFHFSDGDNMESDNARCISILKDMLPRINMFAYGEVRSESDSNRSSSFSNAVSDIKDAKMTSHVLVKKSDVYPALQKFLKRDFSEVSKK